MSFLSGLADLIFPPRCTFCRHFLKSSRQGICDDCRNSLPYTGTDCKQTGDFFTLCVSPLYYENEVRESLLRYKFGEATGYAAHYGKLLADCVRENLSGRYELITWAPLSQKRLKKRGYDQAMLLAMACALELGDVAVETLKKPGEVPAQSGVGSPEKRRANISGAYEVKDAELIRGKRILLIDDIVTSGATLSECARTLLMAGADSVCCATLARSRRTTSEA